MKKPIVSAVAAIALPNRVLGNKGKIPWQIPEDIKFFRDKTLGRVMIMGRKTYDSIGKALPGRTSIVVTRDESYKLNDAMVVHTIDDALKIAREKEQEEIMVIGGGEIFKAALPQTDRLYITIVEGEYEGDAFFPEYPEFTKVISERKSEGNGYKYVFLTLERG